MEISIKVYGENGETVKECKTETVNIKFGVIRAIMGLLEADSIEDTNDLTKRIIYAWKELIGLLTKTFPEMTEEDWDNVDTKDVVKVVWNILGYTIKEVAKIPSEKNEERA